MREERLSRIVDLVRVRGMMSFQELQEIFKISPSTLRRDISELANRGLLKKIHGGVKATSGVIAEEEFLKRIKRNRDLKEKIALMALDLVKDGDVIFLDASSTVYIFATFLKNKRNYLKVITTNLLTAFELSKNRTNDVIITTGKINPNNISTEDALTINSLKNFKATKFIFSCHGFNPSEGTYEVNLQEANVKNIMFEKSEERYLLVDSTKFYKTSGMFCFDVDEIDVIVVDEIDKKGIEHLKSRKVRIITKVVEK